MKQKSGTSCRFNTFKLGLMSPKCSIAHLQLACYCFAGFWRVCLDFMDFNFWNFFRIETNPNEHASASPFPKGWDVQDNVRKDNELHVCPTWLPTRRRCSPRRKSFSMSSITIMCWTEIQKRKRERVTSDVEFTHSHCCNVPVEKYHQSTATWRFSFYFLHMFQSNHPALPDRNRVISKVEHPPYSLHTRAFSF